MPAWILVISLTGLIMSLMMAPWLQTAPTRVLSDTAMGAAFGASCRRGVSFVESHSRAPTVAEWQALSPNIVPLNMSLWVSRPPAPFQVQCWALFPSLGSLTANTSGVALAGTGYSANTADPAVGTSVDGITMHSAAHSNKALWVPVPVGAVVMMVTVL
jgi:hypothetical protein